jgi:DNA mismatch endonuclease (patch repair protein)
MERNAERDRRSTSLAVDLGWTVLRVWECEVGRDGGKAAQRVLDHLSSRAAGSA